MYFAKLERKTPAMRSTFFLIAYDIINNNKRKHLESEFTLLNSKTFAEVAV